MVIWNKILKIRMTRIWFFSYVIIALITVAFNLMAYIHVDTLFSVQNENYASNILENQKNEIDNKISRINSTGIEISGSEAVRRLAFLQGNIYGANYVLAENVMKVLSVYKNSDNSFDNIYIYFNNIDYCVGMNNANNADSYYQLNIEPFGITKSEWLQNMADSRLGDCILYSADDKQNVTFFYSVYGTERFVPFATIAIQIDGKKLINSEKIGDQASFCINNEKGIFLTDKRKENKKCESVIKEYGAGTGIRNLKNNMTVIAAASEESSFRYYYILDRNVFLKYVNAARRTVAVLNTFAVLLMIFVAMWLANINYNPIKAIMGLFDGNKNKDDTEFNYIRNKISNLMSENRTMASKIDAVDNDIVREALTAKIVNGRFSEAECEEMRKILAEIGYLFPYDSFMVILVRIELNFSMFFDNVCNASEDYGLAKVAIENVFNEILGEICTVNSCNLNGDICFIANLKQQTDYNTVVKKVKYIREFLKENINIDFMTGISTLHTSINELRLCLGEAEECMKEYFLSGGIICYDEPDKIKGDKSTVSEAMETKLLEGLRCGYINVVNEALASIFESSFKSSSQSIYVVKSVIYNLVATIKKSVANDEDNNSIILEILKNADKIETSKEVDAVCESICKWTQNICEVNKRDDVLKLDKTLDAIKTFIEENYSDADLTVAVAAAYGNISVQYLSANFKKKYCIGVAEYIANVRMNAAKNLLADSDMKIADIAQTVGYLNVRSFMRVFKRNVGMSPGAYRDAKN